ncbi:MAG: hypothetical protein ISS49_16805 [Anaerolineae bacterium]|nr:hypothetical protein [Anaerolineae bacterium]
MNHSNLEGLTEEEKLVAELGLLGIRYLSRQTSYQATRVRPPEALLADLVRQPSARVREAVIAVLLSHPEYAEAVPAALGRLRPPEQLTLQSFYMAAVLLQQEHANRLWPFLAVRWRWLSELHDASAELGVPTEGTPRERLAELGREHRRRAQAMVNWTGTYEQVARQLLRQWEVESRWNR